ncbi:hypothetical protein BWZ20_01965 [Winogradskyella sp. J14-2]|uniref:hypothetical protein n=1 Tax=Winogradskyella sp. J14-2 TaxID=1936080 RepID=UPI000972B16F|nr:hypothetical protein [Winogradskyella sp. J14-2]APY07142.1 hypothetical protein BWZ20_01965 [Winogradskyella sp. J14-2]
MKFTQRLAYYLGGFSIGLIILMFFLNGKEASCDYGPNARTVKNISSKPITYSNEVLGFTNYHTIDSTTVINLIKYGNVDFSKSSTDLDSCKIYHINNIYKDKEIQLSIENCDSIAKILVMSYVNE